MGGRRRVGKAPAERSRAAEACLGESDQSARPLTITNPQQEDRALQLASELQSVLSAASDPMVVRQLECRAKVLQELCRTERAAFDNQNHFAEMALRCARKLGEILKDTVQQGRPKKRYSAGTFSTAAQLPFGIS